MKKGECCRQMAIYSSQLSDTADLPLSPDAAFLGAQVRTDEAFRHQLENKIK